MHVLVGMVSERQNANDRALVRPKSGVELVVTITVANNIPFRRRNQEFPINPSPATVATAIKSIA